MKHVHLLTAAAVAGIVLASAGPLRAQAAQQPEIHYLTVTTFQVPFGDERGKVFTWIDSVMVPTAKMNPHVVSFRIANHNWGHNAQDIVLMFEYASWNDINAPCEACNKWFEQKQPKEGTPERAKWDEALNTFLKYYSSHADEIYAVNMKRSK